MQDNSFYAGLLGLADSINDSQVLQATRPDGYLLIIDAPERPGGFTVTWEDPADSSQGLEYTGSLAGAAEYIQLEYGDLVFEVVPRL